MNTIRIGLVSAALAGMIAVGSAAQDATNGDEIAFRSIGGTSYVIHSYTTVGDSSFTPPAPVNDTLDVEYLVVAGGGGGGRATTGTTQGNGGGGAGGYRSAVIGELSGANTAAEPVLTLSHGISYDVTVGDGGVANQNGDASSFDTIEALGGGHGGYRTPNDAVPANPGGSEGGSGGGTHPSGGTAADGGAGTPAQGMRGGNRFSTGTAGAPGGGGASQTGSDVPQGGSNTSGSAGGDGLQSNITGILTSYAGGGGGGARRAGGTSVAPGGLGGGGSGANGTAAHFTDWVDATDGLANTGGGGGGTSDRSVAGVGGSGIVVVRYALNDVTEWSSDSTYTVPGAVRRLLIEDEVDVQTSSVNPLSILENGELNVGTGATLTVDPLETLTVSSGTVLGGGGVIYGGLTLAEGAQLAFDPDVFLTVNGTLDLGTLSVAGLVGLTEDVGIKTYTLIAGDKTNWTFSGMGNLGEENKVEIGDSGKFAYFEEGSLQLVVIPEPHTLGLLLAAGALLALRRRRNGQDG